DIFEKILVIEDNKQDRDIISIYLKKNGNLPL
ncbi:hypothetical protein LCGC14_1661860, partial [marine sediment metagenome]